MTFVQDFKDFLYKLRDDYGFLLPVDRFQVCLTCASDIADVEEVCYRTQSLICESEEQIDIFQSVFAQTFLNWIPVSEEELEIEKRNRKNSGNKQKTPEELRNEIKQQEASNDDRKKHIDSITESLKDDSDRKMAEQALSFAQESVEKQKEIVELMEAKEKEAHNAVVPDPHNVKFRDALSQFDAAVDAAIAESEKVNANEGTALTKLKQDLHASLKSPAFQTDLSQYEKACMQLAAHARSGYQSKLFSCILNAVSAIKLLAAKAKSAVSKDSGNNFKSVSAQLKTARKDYNEAASARDEAAAELNLIKMSECSKKNQLKQMQDAVTKSQKKLQALQRQLHDAESKSEGSAGTNVKNHAMSHRTEFLGGIHAVQTTSQIKELLDTDLKQMSNTEKQQVLSYIRTNARVFKQSLRRKSTVYQHRKVDVKATVRESRKTDGEPVIIKYKAPKKSHAKVMILVDISGSCRQASTLALYFMALMNEAFPAGCRKFAFVNTLIPVDRYFVDVSVDDGVEHLVNAIPTRGVYSDYGETFRQFREMCAGDISKETTVIILGDARNNSRVSHAQDLKYMADRCYRMFWLNTDDVKKWDQGDSIISEYTEAGAEVYPIQTAGDLIGFLSNMSLKPRI